MSFEFDVERTCPSCDGAGGQELPSPDPLGGWFWKKCRRCDGTGSLWTHVRPIDAAERNRPD